jgi:cellulose synthase/poly-beta-1,6-N-acetylglucosamine synthase-like glycosyltransferase
MTRTVVTVVFWGSVGAVLYSYALYPLLLKVLARLFGKAVIEDEQLRPTVAVVVPVYNEEDVIRRKIENVLAIDYPPDLLSVWVGSDQSTDRTTDIVRSFSDSRIHLWEAPSRGGKTEVINRLVRRLSADIVVLTDGNTMHEADILLKAIPVFGDPSVGGVAGHINHATRSGDEREERLYRSFESVQKTYESALHSTVSAYGGFYAIRRELFRPLPPNAYSNDDVLIPLNVVRQGYRMVFKMYALSREDTTENVAKEFSRRVRIGAGNFQAFFWLAEFLNPLRGWPWFCYVSHKVTRWFSPFAVLLGLISCVLLAVLTPQPLYRVLAAAGAAVGGLGLLGLVLPFRLTRYTLYFLAMTAALGLGFIRFCRGIRSAAWERTARG